MTSWFCRVFAARTGERDVTCHVFNAERIALVSFLAVVSLLCWGVLR